MNKIGFILVCLNSCFVQLAFGQFAEQIRSGRPGQSIGPFTTGKNILQFQAGYNYTAYESDNLIYQEGFSHSVENIMRFGLTEKFELGLGLGYQQTKDIALGQVFPNDGINDFSLRARSNIYQGKKWIPSIGYQIGIKLPIGDLSPTFLAPKLVLMTAQRPIEKLGIITNTGISWNGINAQPEFLYIINLNYSITDKWGIFIENYAHFNTNYFDTKFDGGVAYLVSNDLQLDFYGGFDKNGTADQDWFIDLGVSWRLNCKRNEK